MGKLELIVNNVHTNEVVTDELLDYFAEQYFIIKDELEADGMIYDVTFSQFVNKQLQNRKVGR